MAHTLKELKKLLTKLNDKLLKLELTTSDIGERDFPNRYHQIVYRELKALVDDSWTIKDLKYSGFPDISVDNFGLEVKVIRFKDDNYVTLGQSIFSKKLTKRIFLLLAKFDADGSVSITIDRYYKYVYGIVQDHKSRFQLDFSKPNKQSEAEYDAIVKKAQDKYNSEEIHWTSFNKENFGK